MNGKDKPGAGQAPKNETPGERGVKSRIRKLLRSRRIPVFVGCLCLMFVISSAFFYPDAFEGNVLQQHDIQQGVANGQEAKEYRETTGQTTWWTGSLFSGMPTFQISPTYPSNHLFSWINTAMGLGLPSPANLLMMMMLGMFILLIAMRMRWYVALIGAIAYGFSSYFVILIGAGHIWKFVTLAYIPPTIAGMVLCYRGRYLAGGALAAIMAMMQIASNHVQMTYYFLFVVVGFVIAYLVQTIRSGRWKRFGMATGTLAVAAALAVTANLPSLYNTYEYSKSTIRGGHSELSQPVQPGEEANRTDGLDRDYITQYSYGQAETFSLLIPNIKGGASAKPEKGEVKMLSLAELDAAKEPAADPLVGQYLQYVSQYFGEPEGTNGPVYVGALIFALFLVGCFIVRGPVKWVLLVLTIFAILLSWGRNLMWFTDFMIDYMPMYSKFRTVESILVIAEFTMPVLAMMALQKLIVEKDAFVHYRRGICFGFGVAMAFCLLAMLVPSIFGEVITDNDRFTDRMLTEQLLAQGYPADQVSYFSLSNPQIYSTIEQLRYSMIESDALRSLVVCGLGFGFLLLYFYNKVTAAVAVTGLGVVVLVDLFAVNKRYLSTESFLPAPSPQTSEIQKIPADDIILQDTAMNYRVMDVPRFQLAAPSYFHKAVGGYHAAKLTRYQDLIDRHLMPLVAGRATEADIQVLNMLNAKYFIDESGQVSLNEEALGNAWFVDSIAYVDGADAEMDALSHINPATTAVADRKFSKLLGQASPKTAGDTIYETTYAPNRLTYRTRSAHGGLAVFSEIYFPWGWEVTIDGRKVDGPGRADYVLRALPIPAGEHTVEMTFNPRSVQETVTAATVAVMIIYVMALLAIVSWITGYGLRPDND